MDECSLARRDCVPCKGGVQPLAGEDLLRLHAELGRGWEVVDDHHLEKTFAFPDFKEALAFVNRVGELAEAQGHHPDLYLTWGEVTVTVYTHKIEGLTPSDFYFAAKTDEV